MSTISSSDAKCDDEEDEPIFGFASLQSLGAFVGANLLDVLVDGPEKSGFSCLIVALDNNGKDVLSQFPPMPWVSSLAVSEKKNRPVTH